MTQDEFDELYRNSKWGANLYAEVIAGVGDAIALIVGATARQVDPATYAQSLRAQIAAAEQLHSTPSFSIRIAKMALAAVVAEVPPKR